MHTEIALTEQITGSLSIDHVVDCMKFIIEAFIRTAHHTCSLHLDFLTFFAPQGQIARHKMIIVMNFWQIYTDLSSLQCIMELFFTPVA